MKNTDGRRTGVGDYLGFNLCNLPKIWLECFKEILLKKSIRKKYQTKNLKSTEQFFYIMFCFQRLIGGVHL